MSNINITNLDIGNVILKNAEFSDDLLEFAFPGEFKAGTILARGDVTGKLLAYVKDGGPTAGDGVPLAVLTYDISTAIPGDFPARVAISGEMRLERLIIQADGDSSNIDNVVRDALRNYSIVAINTQELNILDNQ